MAAVSDVMDALATLVASVLYPSGGPPGIFDFPIIIYAGWPDAQTLDVDMVEAAGKPTKAHVAIFPLQMERNTTRYPVERVAMPTPAKTYSLGVAGQDVTVGGAPPTTYFGQNLAISINGHAYVTHAMDGQTPSQLAAALQALIVADVAGTSVAGPVLTLPAGARIDHVRVGATGSTIREVRRQERQFQIGVWSSDPKSRADIADAFDPVLADTPRLALADGSVARMTYVHSREDDFVQKQRIYRRLVVYAVEYPTTITESATEIVATVTNLRDQQDHIISTSEG